MNSCTLVGSQHLEGLVSCRAMCIPVHSACWSEIMHEDYCNVTLGAALKRLSLFCTVQACMAPKEACVLYQRVHYSACVSLITSLMQTPGQCGVDPPLWSE